MKLKNQKLKNDLTNKDIIIKYCQDIQDNIIPACRETKQACYRFFYYVVNPNYYYDEDAVDTVISFINTLELTEQATPTKFILEPWETFIIASIYGFYNKKTKERVINYVYIELAKKNGKSQLVVALALYDFLFVTDSQVVIAANSLRQAKDVDFKKAKQFCEQLDKKQKYLVHYYNSIKFKFNELLTVASDSSKLDGLNPNMAIIDEFHEANNGNLYNNLKSAMASRDNPLLLVITTAGFNRESFCYSLRSYCKAVLDGTIKDDSQFSIIYTIDEEDLDNIDNIDVQRKANPNLGISVKYKAIANEVNKAKNNNIERNGILVKHFNMWLKSNTLEDWIEEKYIIDAMQTLDIENDIKFKNVECYVGVDLSTVSDLSSVTYLFKIDDIYYFKSFPYLPDYQINKSVNCEIYKQAISNNQLIVTPGNVIDYDYIANNIIEKNKKNEIIKIGYDKWNSTQWVINMTEAGFNMQPYSQMNGNLNKPIKEFERLLKSNKIIIDKNILTKWCFSNIIIKPDKKGNYAFDKSNNNKKIDIVASMINALGCYLDSPHMGTNVW